MIARAAWIAACAMLSALPARAGGPSFDGERAWRDLQALVAVGARPAGSDGARRVRGLLVERLRQAGFSARIAPFEPSPRPAGWRGGELANVIGERTGRTGEILLVASHFDARAPDAANESASGPALVLELARALAAAKLERTVRLAFFDGHESLELGNAPPALAGSRALAAQMDREGELGRVRALIVVWRVADRDLRLETSVLSGPELVKRAGAAARALEPPQILEPLPRAHFDGDHLPFVRRGVRAVLPLVDLRFGRVDAPDRLSRESLARSGELVLALTRALTQEP